LGAVAIIAIAAFASAPGQSPDIKPWTGALRDEGGKAIAGAIVRLQSDHALQTAKTAADGRFTFPTITAGKYSVSVDHKGKTGAYIPQIKLTGAGMEG